MIISLLLFVVNVYLYEWARDVGTGGNVFTALDFDESGNIYCLGDYSESEDEVHYLKFDPDGNTVFRKGLYDNPFVYSVDLAVWDDGEAAILGIDDSSDYFIFLVNTLGAVYNSKKLSLPEYARIEKVEADGGYILVGKGDDSAAPLSGYDMYISRLAFDLSSIWRKTYTFISSDARIDYGVSIIPAPDGNFFVGGYMSRDPVNFFLCNMTISKIDVADGSVIYTYEIGIGEEGTYLRDICLLSDGSIGFVGSNNFDTEFGIIGRVNVSSSEEHSSLIWAKKIEMADQGFMPWRCEGSEDESLIVLSSSTEVVARRRSAKMVGNYGTLSKYTSDGTLIFGKAYDHYRTGVSLGVSPLNGDIYIGGDSIASAGDFFLARASSINGTTCPAQETNLVELDDGAQYSENYLIEGEEIYFDRYDLYSLPASDGEYYYPESVYSDPLPTDSESWVNEVYYGCAECFGWPIEDSQACHNDLDHGECVWQNECDCYEGYVTDDCTLWTCGGVPMNETEEVCSGVGNCTDVNQCNCSENYYGETCNLTYCRGLRTDEPGACSDHGICFPEEICKCDEYYHGPDCNVTECGGILSNYTEDVCNFGKGTCTVPNHCECFSELYPKFEGENCDECIEGWYGENCDITICYGVFSNYTDGVTDSQGRQACAGHGDCESVDDCSCDNLDEWSGENCDIVMCFGISAEETDDVCSSRGECVDVDSCTCIEDYYGAECLEKVAVSSAMFVDSSMDELVIPYYVLQDFFDDSKLELKSGNPFNCSKVVANWEEFLIYNSSSCVFTFIEVTADYLLSELLIIRIINPNLYSSSTEEEEDRRRELPPIPDYELPNNFTVYIKTVTYPERIFAVYTTSYVEEEADGDVTDDTEGEAGPSGASFLWAAIAFPTAFVAFVIVTILCMICILALLCVCGTCIFCAVGSVTSLIVKKNIDQRKGLQKFGKLRNVDILLKEQELDADDSIAHIKINKGLFEVDYDDIKIDKILGEGGSQSVVYRAKWKHQIVAFKCFKTRHICSSQDDFNEFEREVQVLSSISHPNIIQFFGATLNPPRVGILMEFCENGDLDIFLRQNFSEEEPYPMNEKLRMLFEISMSLDYLHSRSIIHRDLKMENVLVDSKEVCKLMDFGLSKIVDRMSKMKTQKIGTSAYMSPEIVNSGIYDEKCDVFSYAILVYIMVTEKWMPYDENLTNIEMRVAADPDFRPSLSAVHECKFFESDEDREAVKDIIVRCWDHDPKERYSQGDVCGILQKNFFEDRYDLVKRPDMLSVRQTHSITHRKSQEEEEYEGIPDVLSDEKEAEEEKEEEEEEEEPKQNSSSRLEEVLERVRLLESENEELKKRLEKYEKEEKGDEDESEEEDNSFEDF